MSNNDDPLAEAYERGLAAEKAGDIEGAVRAFDEVLRLDPADHGGVAVRLAALGAGAVPERASRAYVATLFDQHAGVFDAMLVDDLGYAVPMMLREEIDRLGLGPFAAMLDLGCGTGLSGESLEDRTGTRTGVDLSEGMIEIADEKEVYDQLFVADVEDFLAEGEGGPWDLIVATDVLPYLGDLEGFFAGLARRLAPGGVVALSSETLPELAADWTVGPFQRFAHAEGYLRRLMSAHTLEPLVFEPITVRLNEGVPVPGYLILMRARFA